MQTVLAPSGAKEVTKTYYFYWCCYFETPACSMTMVFKKNGRTCRFNEMQLRYSKFRIRLKVFFFEIKKRLETMKKSFQYTDEYS